VNQQSQLIHPENHSELDQEGDHLSATSTDLLKELLKTVEVPSANEMSSIELVADKLCVELPSSVNGTQSCSIGL